ncbi:hypothetical protein [Kitasatospora sp. NPDC050543]|uniref:hypothetical protein n=1 Tax=Kitasatospora sp. NPDC050543 TaxID=3364054 RepID=UPI0037B8E4A8
MGILYDYFSARDDRAAASAFAEGPADRGFDTVPVKGVDPQILLGRAAALLLDQPLALVTTHARYGRLVSDPDAESVWILTLPDDLRDALADAGGERLAAVAGPWSRAEEFSGEGDPVDLAGFLDQLAALARRARAAGRGLYCRVCL